MTKKPPTISPFPLVPHDTSTGQMPQQMHKKSLANKKLLAEQVFCCTTSKLYGRIFLQHQKSITRERTENEIAVPAGNTSVVLEKHTACHPS